MIGTATSVINWTLSPRVIAAIDELESGGGERFETLEELFESWDELSDDDDEELLMAQNVLAMLTMVLDDEENGVEIEEI